MYRLSTIIAGLFFALTVSATASANTVADNRVVAKVIKEKLSAAEAEAILQTPYDGFVEIRGKARKGSFEFSKVKSKASYPDNRWEETARSIVEQVEISFDLSTSSSRFKPSATAYVVFYKDGIEGVSTAGARQVNITDGSGDYLALLIIKQKAPKGNVSVQSGSFNKVSKTGSNKVYKFKLDA